MWLWYAEHILRHAGVFREDTSMDTNCFPSASSTIFPSSNHRVLDRIATMKEGALLVNWDDRLPFKLDIEDLHNAR